VLPVAVRAPPPSTATPPPWAASAGSAATAWLSATTTFASVSEPLCTRIPPPAGARPPLTVRPEIVTSAEVMEKTRLRPPASTSRRAAPGPWIVTLRSSASSPQVRRMVWPFSRLANWIVSPAWAAATAARSDPCPSSATVLTVSVLGRARPSSNSRRGTKLHRGKREDCPGDFHD
jgi:hypothetical protein